MSPGSAMTLRCSALCWTRQSTNLRVRTMRPKPTIVLIRFRRQLLPWRTVGPWLERVDRDSARNIPVAALRRRRAVVWWNGGAPGRHFPDAIYRFDRDAADQIGRASCRERV